MPILWPPDVKNRLRCWERLKVGGEGDNREWDGWIASPTQQTWVWVGVGSWWWTGKPGMLQSMGSQKVGHSWATVLTMHTYMYSYLTSRACMLSHGQLFANQRTVAHQAPLSMGFSRQEYWHELSFPTIYLTLSQCLPLHGEIEYRGAEASFCLTYHICIYSYLFSK